MHNKGSGFHEVRLHEILPKYILYLKIIIVNLFIHQISVSSCTQQPDFHCYVYNGNFYIAGSCYQKLLGLFC